MIRQESTEVSFGGLLLKQTIVLPVVLMVAMVLLFSSATCFAQSCEFDWTAQYDPRNRDQNRDETNGPVPVVGSDDVIGYTADGNRNDEDDIAASPLTLSIFARRRWQNQLVHFSYNNCPMEGKESKPTEHKISVQDAASKFGYDTNITQFYDCQIDRQWNAAVASAVAVIKSTGNGKKFYWIQAGPHEIAYRALEQVKKEAPEKLQHVVLVSHSGVNNVSTHRIRDSLGGGCGHTLRDCLALDERIGYFYTSLQGGGENFGSKKADNWAAAEWMSTIDCDAWNFVEERFRKAQEMYGKPGLDASDAGMAYTLATCDPDGNFVTLTKWVDGWCPDAQPYFGNGIKIGEVSTDSAKVWVRLTQRAAPNWNGDKWRGTADRDFDVGELGEKQFAKDASLAEMEGSLIGLDGTVRVSWWPEERPDTKRQTEWLAVDPQRDFTRQIAVEGLSSQQNYVLKVESRSIDGEQGQSLSGSFRTASGSSTSEPTRFVVSTCQSWKTRDKGTAGLQIYDHMLDLDPAFFVHLGDIVYYDKRSAGGDVDVRTPETARFHWNRWYGCSDIVNFHTRVPSFFIKDDHDTVTNDSEPGMSVGKLTWNKGLSIFREQVPMGKSTYRSRRWSKDLHFWIVEVRDFRSPKKMKDGPEKSIWGAEQKAWFKKEVLASGAPFKILFSPTPIVGPDRPNKKDNHANGNWAHEGDELRKFCADHNVIIINGDRHWQYHSIDDQTGAHEFSSGATSEAHANGFSMDQRSDEHQYLAIIGGFLSGEVTPTGDGKQLTLRHHRVDGSVAYEYTFEE